MSIHADWPFVTVHWQPSLGGVHMQWHSTPSSRGYRVAMETGLRLLERQGATHWLDDCRRLDQLEEADRQWYVEDWFARAKALSLKYLAIIPSEDDMLAPWVNPPGCAPRDVRIGMGREPCVAFFARPMDAMIWLGRTSGVRSVMPLEPSNDTSSRSLVSLGR